MGMIMVVIKVSFQTISFQFCFDQNSKGISEKECLQETQVA